MPIEGSSKPYRVLARTYRPTRLSELIGQGALVRTLGNAFASGRIAHAFLLTGIRGVGKTTTARIIARGLNCTGADGAGGPTPEPCGLCPSCRSIDEDRSIDVIETDAASNTGKDDVLDLLSGIAFGPAASRFKIYILDEVHMLSQQAWAALLKTVEEPPAHAKFVFATTEVRKVPVTVLSRCQRFDLRRIEAPVLQAHLASVAEREAIEVEDEALAMVVRAAEGSVRDSLSLLDQAIALSSGPVTASHVRDMLGLADRAVVLTLTEHLLAGEAAKALAIWNDLWTQGADPLQLVQDLLATVHWLSRLHVTPDSAAPFHVGAGEAARGKALATAQGAHVLARAWQVLLKGLAEVRDAPDPSAALEMLLIRLACLAELPPPAEIARLVRGETGVAATGSAGAVRTPPQPVPMARAVGDDRVQASVAPSVHNAPATPTRPADFAALVDLLARNGEPAVAALAGSGAMPVRFEPPVVEIRLAPSAPPDLPGRLSEALRRVTGERWVVALGHGPAGRTLAEEHKAWREQRLAELSKDPRVRSVLDQFPGSSLVDVERSRDPTRTHPTPLASTKERP